MTVQKRQDAVRTNFKLVFIHTVCKLSNETGNVAPDLATLRRRDLEGRSDSAVTFNEESNDDFGFDSHEVPYYSSLTSVQPIEVSWNSDLNTYLNLKCPALFDCDIKNMGCKKTVAKNKVDLQMDLILRFKVKSKVTIGLLVESYHSSFLNPHECGVLNFQWTLLGTVSGVRCLGQRYYMMTDN
ncbi:hypothetical protein NQ318_017819 [Aromia moschata]|uniref:Uncharacterized protein n=1 Tax=Aromia moschata TaxID=1265417 RepID=A0AAV8YGS4_9CUCU|nr:hypothetical protein NQ318_017819 [Aromia moschata]